MADGEHDRTVMLLGARLQMHVEARNLGDIYSPDTTFQIGSNERLPDLAFVSAARVPEGAVPEDRRGIAPDLAIEVISPDDLWDEVNCKLAAHFVAGAWEVWLVSPGLRTVSIHISPTRFRILKEDDDLTSEELLPGFHCRVSEIFGKPVSEDAEARIQ